MAKTIRQQIADIDATIEKLTAKRAELEPQLANEVDFSAVKQGATVTFSYGKGDTKKVLTGLVLGRKDAEPGVKGGDYIRVAVGEGFEAQIVTVNVASVTAVTAV